MTIKAQVEGIGTLEFPDGTDPSVVQATVKKQIASRGAAPQTPGQPDLYAGMSHQTPGDQQPELPYWNQVFLSMHDNMDERQRYLEKVGGKGSVERKTNHDGNEYLVYKDKSGVPYLINGNGDSTAAFGAETLGQAPEILSSGGGAVAGGIAGSPLGPLGVLGGALLGSGIGGAAGKGVKDLGKAAAGTFAKNPSQIAGSEYDAFIAGVAGEAFGRTASVLPKRAMGKGILPGAISEVSDINREAAHKAYRAGAKPDIVSVAPGMKHMQYETVVAKQIGGKYTAQDALNKKYLESEVRNTLKLGGVPDAMIDSILKDAENPYGTHSFADVGQFLMDSTKAHVSSIEQSQAVGRSIAQTHIDSQLAHVTKYLDGNVDKKLPEDVAKIITSAKRDFTTAANAQYTAIDRQLGDRQVIDPNNLQEVASELVQKLPAADRQLLVKEMAQQYGKHNLSEPEAMLLEAFGVELPKGEKLTFKQAHDLRTAFRDRVDYGKITPKSIKEGEMSRLAAAVDKDMTDAAQHDPSVAAVRGNLEAVDAWYKENVAKFYDASLKKFTNQVRSGWVPNPETVVAQILPLQGKVRQDAIGKLRTVLGEPMWKRVQNEHMKMTLGGFRDEAGQFDGLKALKQLKDRQWGDSFRDMHGADQYDNLKKLAYMTAVQGEKIPVDESMAAIPFNKIVRHMEKIKAERDRFFSNDIASTFADPKTTPEEAYRWVVEPKNHSRLVAVQKLFGDNSEQMTMIRRAALLQLGRYANENAVAHEGNNAIKNALNQYSKEQMEILFPNGMIKALNGLNETIKFMFPFESGVPMPTTAMKAGLVQNKPMMNRLREIATKIVVRHVYTHPAWVKTLMIGWDASPQAIARTKAAIENLVRAETQATMGDTGPESQPATVQ